MNRFSGHITSYLHFLPREGSPSVLGQSGTALLRSKIVANLRKRYMSLVIPFLFISFHENKLPTPLNFGAFSTHYLEQISGTWYYLSFLKYFFLSYCRPSCTGSLKVYTDFPGAQIPLTDNLEQNTNELHLKTLRTFSCLNGGAGGPNYCCCQFV